MTLKEPALASKQYISPIRLFKHCDINYNGDVNLPRIKKQLTAEFDFSKTGFIEAEGYTYNKNDVLEEIDRADFSTRLVYHDKIWQNKNMLAVLEDNKVELSAIKYSFDAFQNDTVFDEFFSPYFASPFNHISRSFLTNNQLEELGQWLWYRDFLQAPEREEAFKSIRLFFDENDRIFKNISKDNYKTFRPKIRHWLGGGWPMMFNNLPEEFYHVKNGIIVDLINLTVKIQKSNPQDCRLISSGLIQLRDVPESLSTTISSNHSIYNGSASSSSGSNNYWWVVWLVIFVIRILATGGCN